MICSTRICIYSFRLSSASYFLYILVGGSFSFHPRGLIHFYTLISSLHPLKWLQFTQVGGDRQWGWNSVWSFSSPKARTACEGNIKEDQQHVKPNHGPRFQFGGWIFCGPKPIDYFSSPTSLPLVIDFLGTFLVAARSLALALSRHLFYMELDHKDPQMAWNSASSVFFFWGRWLLHTCFRKNWSLCVL